mgnify:CR=1 FL=1
MNKDLTINIDDKILNIRSGCLLIYEYTYLIECTKNENHQTIPGGRVKLMETSREAIIRELKEELDFDAKEEKLIKVTTLENLFKHKNKEIQEIYFIYKYILSKEEYNKIKQIKTNKDHPNSYYKLISKKDIKNTNILPLELKELIKNDKTNYEKSCGALIIKDKKALIIKQTNNLWSIPKGHIDTGETEQETAIREVKEETNLDIEIKDNFRETVTYFPNKPNTIKEVVFFLATPLNNNIKLQEKEVETYKWMDLKEIEKLFEGRCDQKVITKARQVLNIK